MDSKKRPHADTDDSVLAKKRAIAGSNGSPIANGTSHDEEEPTPDDNLELFRKEAIYRRMKHYSRENERCHAKITELERRKSTCEAGSAAIAACWTQLVEALQLLVKPEDLHQGKIDFKDIFDLCSHVEDDPTPELAAALGDTANITQSLVTKFMQLGGSSRLQISQDGFYSQCQKKQTESAALRSQLSVMRRKLEDCESERDKYRTALTASENKLERSRSGTIRAMESRKPKPEDTKDNQDASDVKREGTEETERKPSSPALSPQQHTHSNGLADSSELDSLRELVALREAKIIELEKESAILRDEKTLLEVDLKVPSLERIAENPHYKVVLHHASSLEATLAEKNAIITRLTEEITILKSARSEWEEGVVADANQANQELKSMLTKRDVENARLREQRDQQAAELNERRQKESYKLTSIQEIKNLAQTRSDRITVLESEVRRCKAQLAANAGNEELMNFFLDGNLEISSFIEGLKEQKQRAEDRVAALEQTFSVYQNQHPNVAQHVKAEANALQQLAGAKAQLEKYQKVYGASSTSPPNTAQLADQLKQKQAELEKLRLMEVQHVEAEKSLYSELEKLSTAWEALDGQLKSKVFDLLSMEERVAKSAQDRAKSENKYYAAMRDKDAIENERKILQRHVEKQAKAVDRLMDAEKNLQSRAATLEKEITMYKRTLESSKDNLHRLEETCFEWKARAEGEKLRSQELLTNLNEREKTLTTKRTELRKLEDGLIRSKKDLDRQASRVKEAATIPLINQSSTDSSSDPEADHLRQIVKCSTCKVGFRSVAITKCSHTFCKSCIDSRIATRQRRCPACNIAFAQSDIVTVYWQ